MTAEQISKTRQWVWRILYSSNVFAFTTLLILIAGLYPNNYVLLSVIIAMRDIQFPVALGVIAGVASFIGVVMAPQSITKRIVIITGLTLIFWFGHLTPLFERWDIRAELAVAIAAITAIAILIIHFSPINRLIPQEEPRMEYADDEDGPAGNIVASMLAGFLLLFSSSEVLAQGISPSNKNWTVVTLSADQPGALVKKIEEWRAKNPGILLFSQHVGGAVPHETVYIYYIPCPLAENYRGRTCSP